MTGASVFGQDSPGYDEIVYQEPDDFSPKQMPGKTAAPDNPLGVVTQVLSGRECGRRPPSSSREMGAGEKMIQDELRKADRQPKQDLSAMIDAAKIAPQPAKTVAREEAVAPSSAPIPVPIPAPAQAKKEEIINAEEGPIVEQEVARVKAAQKEAAEAAASAPPAPAVEAHPKPKPPEHAPAPVVEPVQQPAPAEEAKPAPAQETNEGVSIAPPPQEDLTEEILREASAPVIERPGPSPSPPRYMTPQERKHLMDKIIAARKMLAELKGQVITEAPPLPEPAAIEETLEPETAPVAAPKAEEKAASRPAKAAPAVSKIAGDRRTWFGFGKTYSQLEEERQLKAEKTGAVRSERSRQIMAREEEKARQRKMVEGRKKAAIAPRLKEQELIKELKRLEAERKKKIKDLERLLKEYEKKHKLGIL